MAFKSVLSVAGVDHSDQDVRTAASLCAEVGAHLSVLVMLPLPLVMLASAVRRWHPRVAWTTRTPLPHWNNGTGKRFSQDTASSEKTSREIHKLLKRGGAMMSILRTAIRASIGDAVPQRALCNDLTIVSRALLNDTNSVTNGSPVRHRKAGAVVPEGAEATLSPRRVLVGWDSRVEASRSIREALHLLAGAEEVHVALVEPDRCLLTRHGARVSVDLLASAGKSAATVLAQHAIDTSAEMVVMGAYGNRRLRERLFGGVTRWTVGKPSLPLFLAR